MNKHQFIFSKIKGFLKIHFGGDLRELEDGSHLTIGDSKIWISSDDRELTIGYGFVHQHFDSEFDDIQKAIDRFFNLLTKKKRITIFYKGKFSFKHKIDLILNASEFESLGTTMTWFFPFWKKTRKEVVYEGGLIDFSEIENDINKIKNYAK